jgi:hypothetical protein
MSLYKELLRRNRGLLQEQRDAEDQADFTDEATLLKEAIASQRQVWAAGIGIGLLCFASLHYLPSYLIRRLGGEAKVKALNLAEQQAKEDGTAWMKKMTGKIHFFSQCELRVSLCIIVREGRSNIPLVRFLNGKDCLWKGRFRSGQASAHTTVQRNNPKIHMN